MYWQTYAAVILYQSCVWNTEQHNAKPSRDWVTRCVLSHNSSLHEHDFMKASFQKSVHTMNCFARTLTNKQQCNPENSLWVKHIRRMWNLKKIQKSFLNETNQTNSITVKLARVNLNLEQTTFIWEFDPGSVWTLAACLTHASRTEMLC